MQKSAPAPSWYYEALSAFDGSRLTSHYSLPASSFSMQGPRTRNEDRTFVLWSGRRHDRPPMLTVGLLDGIGGSRVGDVAASVAAAHFLAAVVEHQGHIDAASDLQEVLASALSCANQQLWDVFGGASGTTLTAVALTHDSCVAVHVGDSRLYRILPAMAQVTKDDSIAGLFGAETPDLLSDALLQFVGIGSSMLHQSYDLSGALPKRLLLTTDGLHNLGSRALKRLLRGPWTQERLEQDESYWELQDNASAVYVRTKYALIELDQLMPYELSLVCGDRRAHFTMG